MFRVLVFYLNSKVKSLVFKHPVKNLCLIYEISKQKLKEYPFTINTGINLVQ